MSNELVRNVGKEMQILMMRYHFTTTRLEKKTKKQVIGNTKCWWGFGDTQTCIAEKAMATHSSTLAWKIPRMDWATSLSLFTFMHWRRKWQPLQCACLENPRDGGAWWAAVYGVAQSRTRLKRLSSSSSRPVLTMRPPVTTWEGNTAILSWHTHSTNQQFCF